ncbi:MAG: PH domain-containing protein [Bacteroidota bacterium]
MKADSFSEPQRQSGIGVLLIFLTTVYKFIKGFWVLGVYFLLNSPGGKTLFFVGLGMSILAIIALIYSYWYYRKFLFHIDYSKEEFKLEKGVFSTEDIAIPFDKIQQVYLKRSILQRIINVYSLVIETAGSSDKEISIKAISKEKADTLSALLIRAKKDAVIAETGTEELEDDVKKEVLWTHKLHFSDLLKIGLSTNYLRGLALIFVFFSTIFNELRPFVEDYSEGLDEQLDQIPGLLESVGVFVIVAILMLLLSMIITVIEVFIKYYGLKLQQSKNSLELEMGLKTNTKISLQPRRIQLLQVTTNPVQKWLNLYEARFSLASSENTLEKSKIKIPGLGETTVEKIKSFVYADANSGDSLEQTFRPNRILLFRQMFQAVFLPIALSLLFPIFTDYIAVETWAVLVGIYLIIGIIWQLKLFASKKLQIADDFLRLKSGVWNKKEETVETYKLQSLSVTQPIWYKKRNVFNIVFHTAGGDVSFRAVDGKIVPYLNYVLFKIESANKGWM